MLNLYSNNLINNNIANNTNRFKIDFQIPLTTKNNIKKLIRF